MSGFSNQRKQGPSGLAIREIATERRVEILGMLAITEGGIEKNRPLGMGGNRYIRHALESAILQRSGLWSATVVGTARDSLTKLDSAQTSTVSAQVWSYRVQSENEVARSGSRAWTSDLEVPIRPVEPKISELNFSALARELHKQAEEELSRQELSLIWVEGSNPCTMS